MKNTLLFTYSTNILIGLLTVNMNSSLTPKKMKKEREILTSRKILSTKKMCDPILVTLLKMQPH